MSHFLRSRVSADRSAGCSPVCLFARFLEFMLLPLSILLESISIADLAACSKLFIRSVYSAGVVSFEVAEFVEDVGRRYSDQKLAKLRVVPKEVLSFV